MVQDKQNIATQQRQAPPTSADSISRNPSTLSKWSKTRPIKRCKKSKVLKRRKKSKKSNQIINQNKQDCIGGCQQQKNLGFQDLKNGSQVVQIGTKNIKKVAFDPSFLPNSLRQLYESKKKLKNTDLMRPGIKFVKDPTLQSIGKWEKTIIVYQQTYKQNQRCHFGLLIKFNQRIITFDGVSKLWPFKQVQKSFHWMSQPDTWSCGYRVLFWISQISKFGVQRWVQEFEEPINVEISKNLGY